MYIKERGGERERERKGVYLGEDECGLGEK